MTVVNDGVFYDSNIGEFKIVVDDQIVGYADQQQRAWDIYNGHLATRSQHAQRNPANIPFMGEPLAIDDEGNGLAAGVDY